MRLRLLLVACLLAPLALLAAGSSGGASSAVSIRDFVGDWTPDAQSASLVAGHTMSIEKASKAEADSKVGAFWKGSPNLTYLTYCGSGATVSSYLVLSYDWNGGGTMGGCISNKTTPHIVYFGTKSDSGSSHTKTVNGKDVLSGDWGYASNQGYQDFKFTANRPTVKFSVVEQGYKALPKGNGAKFELSKAIGHGEVTLDHVPASVPDFVFNADVEDATGKIRFHKWKVFAHGVVDEDDLTLSAENRGNGGYQLSEGYSRLLVDVKVTKADKDETDHCRVGSKGTLTLRDSHVNRLADFFKLDIPRCHVDEIYLNGEKGAKVAVKLDVE